MGWGHRGKVWEYACKKILKKDFSTEMVFKIINTQHIDFVVFHVKNCDGIDYPAVALVEAKCTGGDHYYALNDKQKRLQWATYFSAKEAIEKMGLPVDVWLYLKKADGVRKILIGSYGEIQVKY
jgi:hypothetical protein